MRNARITGIGHYLPERVITNFDLEKIMDTSNEWIVARTGIRTRRWVQDGDTLSGLAHNAAIKALDMSGKTAEDIQFILFASMASDHVFPGGGCYLQEKLGIPGVPAMDIRNACSGFLYGLSVADQFIKTGKYDTVLLVGAEIQSTSLDLTTRGRDVSVIFGDGAGAAIITSTDESDKGILTTHLHADGRYANKLWTDAPSVNDNPPLTKELLGTDRIFPKMEGRFVFKHAVEKFPEVINEALQTTGYGIHDLDLLIPHQANLRITEAIADQLQIAKEKVFSNIERYGNTTAASIPIAISEAAELGLIKKNSLVCLASFGSGFTWASAIVRW
jgi:3-oxoacyl-[acyl-carrier-protein] synthase III